MRHVKLPAEKMKYHSPSSSPLASTSLSVNPNTNTSASPSTSLISSASPSEPPAKQVPVVEPATKFGKHYFKDIWGTVHRHDYCEYLANQLISKYGKVRILDIGTGCGFLVKTLKDKGCEAWGLEVSDYAIENTCAKGYVLKGDVRNIPFKDNSFEVVHSQGLWEYVPESEILKTYQECLRVGKVQHHNFDTEEGTNLPEHGKITIKPRIWWDKKKIGADFNTQPRVLVACPNHQVKEYSFQRWIDNVKSLTYPSYDIFVSDNSPNDDFMNRWKDQVNIQRIDTTGFDHLAVKRINMSYEAIRKEFLKGDYWWLMIIESDVIPPKDIIEFLLEKGKDADWIDHAYPARGGKEDAEQGIGCALFTRRLMETFNFEELGDNYTSDGGLWMKVRADGRFTTLDMWNFIDVEHLKE